MACSGLTAQCGRLSKWMVNVQEMAIMACADRWVAINVVQTSMLQRGFILLTLCHHVVDVCGFSDKGQVSYKLLQGGMKNLETLKTKG